MCICSSFSSTSSRGSIAALKCFSVQEELAKHVNPVPTNINVGRLSICYFNYLQFSSLHGRGSLTLLVCPEMETWGQHYKIKQPSSQNRIENHCKKNKSFIKNPLCKTFLPIFRSHADTTYSCIFGVFLLFQHNRLTQFNSFQFAPLGLNSIYTK